MITADQIVLHLVGDYLTQSQWMADNKTKRWFPAAVHATIYTIPFLLITNNPYALAAILLPHYLIDRYRLARYVVWFKNGPIDWDYFAISRKRITLPIKLKPLTATGYPESVPSWMSVWLLILADNTIHLITNGIALWVFR